MQRKQSGNTLLVSLILLLIFTIVGLSSVGNVSLNQKMSTSYRDADSAFQAAEAALAEGEAYAETLSVTLSEEHFDPSCTGSSCFTATCEDGRCFSGTYSTGIECDIDEPPTPLAADDATWSTDGRARESQITFPGLNQAPKYIVEFMCYVQADPLAPAPTPPPYTTVDWAYLFRVTSYVLGSNGNSRIVLQSTYKVIR